ncbi:chemoreceptor glutamine deamidase CheD [Ramlibacter sp. USB13]|uniref:Probable chemoreceptor glutamine deamidase CheD n=1 Tax=Ramlibacter cellulosilyticus TaxID=2764187 RepID=A0A923MNP9_9BURK|nr:chemoreceptor glutamine deamidase CheD [Ramlibacter cellulosilyticus]MBC5782453.1 chemoreceptor glutamine deamidase CheD [Ramlibacter cellulosilyticus]
MIESSVPLQYFDREFRVDAVKILPGQYHAAREGAITTVLGSCVSTCLWDPVERIGGMNHFMLPGDQASPGSPWAASARFGVYAMELVINDMIRLGADRRRLVAKVFGGAQLLQGFDRLDVGAKNSEFVLEFLRVEGIRVLAQDLLDVCPRKVHFFVDTGKVQVKRLALTPGEAVERRERDYLRRLDGKRSGDIEIFSPPR